MSSAHAVIDPDLALERAGGNQELARELYQMLQNELPAYAAKIRQLYNDSDYALLHDVVHKLNGASTYCGVPALKEAASSLEDALKQQQDDVFTSGVALVLAEIERLLQAPALPF